MRKCICLLILLSSFSSSILCQKEYGIVAFGTDLITSNEIIDLYRSEMDLLLSKRGKDLPGFNAIKNKLAEKLNSQNEFASININLFESYSGKIDFIFDFVEKGDSIKRLSFRTIEAQEFQDPHGLIALWNEYEELSNSLFKAGEIDDMKCPVVHCTWSFNHPRLERYLSIFSEKVPSNKDRLIDILHQSNSSKFRSAAAFLLVHAGIPDLELADILMPAVEDPAISVRNNSMRVIYYIARKYGALQTSIDIFIRALDFPSFTDRNKALVILRSLPLDNLDTDQLNALLPILLEILKKKDAHNFRNAHLVIQKISHLDHASDDIVEWEEWVNSQIN